MVNGRGGPSPKAEEGRKADLGRGDKGIPEGITGKKFRRDSGLLEYDPQQEKEMTFEIML
jgi:hypothetical protein